MEQTGIEDKFSVTPSNSQVYVDSLRCMLTSCRTFKLLPGEWIISQKSDTESICGYHVNHQHGEMKQIYTTTYQDEIYGIVDACLFDDTLRKAYEIDVDTGSRMGGVVRLLP